MAPLIGIALSVAPFIGEWLFGHKGSEVAEHAAEIVRTVTGTDDPDEARQIINADPQKMAELQVRLGEIAASERTAARQADIEEFKAAVADIQSAREQTVALASQGHILAWGSAVVSGVVLSLFAFMVVVEMLGYGVANDATRRLLEYVLIAASTYWLGSSAGSASKERMLRGSRRDQ